MSGFRLGAFTFRTANAIPEPRLRERVIGLNLQAFDGHQIEGGCGFLGINPVGTLHNVRLGVFDDTPSESSLVGSWYFGRIISLPTDTHYKARFMPWFPDLNNAQYANRVANLVEKFLKRSFTMQTNTVIFEELRFAYRDARRNAADERVRVAHTEIIGRPNLDVTEAPFPGRPLITEVVIKWQS